MKHWMVFLFVFAFLVAIAAETMAADVKFSGEFYVGGMYLDKTSLKKNTITDGPSTAFYFQRLRAKADIIIAPGLFLTTRFDVLERIWGAARSAPGTALDIMSAGTRAENENIAFDWVYLNYASKIGFWRVGYMNDGAWGTVFMDTSVPRGKIAWTYNLPNWMFTLQIAKMAENNYSAVNPTVTAADLDGDKYCGAFRYSWKGGEAGILIGLGRDASKRPAPNNYESLYNNFMPYTKIQYGPLKAQAELIYFVGKLKKYEAGTLLPDERLSTLSAWVDATVDFGMVYVGGTFAYVSGDDPSTTKKEGDAMRNNGGRDWNPCLILWNNDLTYWVGSLAGHGTAANAGPMYNAFLYQLKGGWRPTNNLDIMASVSYATADEKPWATAGNPATVYLDKDYGVEVDVTATYKITNNLSYMIGVGYLFTGDYFKETNSTASVTDNYLLLNKLTLNF